MKPKKSPKVNLENKKFIFLQIGLILTLAAVLVSFEWKSYDKKKIIQFQRFVREEIQDEIIQTKQEIEPPIPPPPQISIIKPVDNNTEIETEIEINIEANMETEVEKYIPLPMKEETKEPDIFYPIESNPEFPGGINALMKYLSNTIQYPKMALENGIYGKVFVTFVVETDGRVTDIKVMRGIGGGCDEEAVRLVENMPKWIPGKQRNKPVRVQFTLPIKFTIR